MNAYELADKLQMDKAKALLYVDTVVQSAEMLRQQADRIAELQNNTCSACGQKVTEDLIHTCSPQTKSLSDEEILNEWLGNDRNFYYFARAIEERHGIK